jgi:type IV pilus assembly protein PilW
MSSLRTLPPSACPQRCTRGPARGRQRGVSPVEILIGLVLGLALLAGLLQLMSGTRQNTRVQTNLQLMQENGRFAIETVGRELRKTGYRWDRALGDELVFPASPPFAAEVVVNGTADTVGLRYQSGGDAWTSTCLGETLPAGTRIEQTLSVVDGELRCRVRVPDSAVANDQTQALLTGVEAMAVTYGVDVDGDSFADAYRAAGVITNWSQVVSINLQLRTVSAEDGVSDGPQPYIDFDGSVVTPADRRLRRTYATVVALRNRLP